MGTIDKLWVKVTCDYCGISEISTASEKGSGWGASWEPLDTFSNFDATFSGRGTVPEVLAAVCKKCQKPAKISSEFGLNRPSDF